MLSSYTADKCIVFAVYCLAHGLIFLLTGIFWDDWTLYSQLSETLVSSFSAAGYPWLGYFHIFMLKLPNAVSIYRLVVFSGYLIAGLCLLDILRNIKILSRQDRLWITLIFTVFPVNSARVALIDSPYAVCYALFFIGFWLLAKHEENSILTYRVVASLFFFVSFITNSLLVFYLIPLLYIYHKQEQGISLRKTIRFTKRNLDLLVIPVVFYVLKSLLGQTHGLYSTYNKITIYGLLNAVGKTATIYVTSFYEVIVSIFTVENMLSSCLIMVIMGIPVYFFFQKDQEKLKAVTYSFKKAVCAGLFFIYVAGYPYYVVGAIPGLHDWYSRHQLLVPLGAAITLYYLVQLLLEKISKGPLLNFFMIITLSIMVSQDIRYYILFQQDWYKQSSLIHNFRASEMLYNNDTFVVDDKTTYLNANRRSYRFYEYNGLLKEAFKDTSRIAIDFPSNSPVKTALDNILVYKSSPEYNMEQYRATSAPLLIEVMTGDYDLRNVREVVNLKAMELFDPSGYEKKINKAVLIKVSDRSIQ